MLGLIIIGIITLVTLGAVIEAIYVLKLLREGFSEIVGLLHSLSRIALKLQARDNNKEE